MKSAELKDGCGRDVRGRGRRDCRAEGGQALPLVLMLIFVAGLFVLAVGKVGGAAVRRTQAVTAADAAALAGAMDGENAARQFAEENGAHLVSFSTPEGDVRVKVRVGDVQATARARSDAVMTGRFKDYSPALRATLTRAEQLVGQLSVVRHDEQVVQLDVASAVRLRPVSKQAGLCLVAVANARDENTFGICEPVMGTRRP